MNEENIKKLLFVFEDACQKYKEFWVDRLELKTKLIGATINRYNLPTFKPIISQKKIKSKSASKEKEIKYT